MEEYRIEKLKVLENKDYIPAQLLGNKRIIRTTETMTIKECKAYIRNYEENKPDGNKGKWVLIDLS